MPGNHFAQMAQDVAVAAGSGSRALARVARVFVDLPRNSACWMAFVKCAICRSSHSKLEAFVITTRSYHSGEVCRVNKVRGRLPDVKKPAVSRATGMADDVTLH